MSSGKKSNLNKHLHRDDFMDDDAFGSNFISPFEDSQSFMQPFKQMEEAMNNMHREFFGQAFGSTTSAFDNAFNELDRVMQNPPKDSNTQYYCSSTTTRMLPNGVVETKKHTRCNDREQREEFREIGDKRVIGRYEKDYKTGEENMRRDLYNMEEDELNEFEEEFNDRAKGFSRGLMGRNHIDNANQKALK